MFFFLTLFLQQVAGYEALEAGVATIPTTLVMFALSERAGRLADRFGPRLFMGFGPLVSAVGIALLLRLDEDISYWTELFPALLIFSLGLVATVTPLTATVLADADEHNAGIASGVNNAIARVAGLLCVAAIGAVVSAVYASDMRGLAVGDTLAVFPGVPQSVIASVHAFHVGIGVCAALVGARRRARPDRHPQPAPRGPLRGLRRRRPLAAGAALSGREGRGVSRITGPWIQSHEEGDRDRIVLHRPDYPFPPARGRVAITLEPGGEVGVRHPGPDDRGVPATGAWSLSGSRLVISAPGLAGEFDVESADEQTLILRRDRKGE